MRSENGIPRPCQPSNLAQEVRDLRRELAELKARRNFVSVERIVEGGTINENVGKQLTETVQKDIVIDGGNLGEGALDGQRMVGAIIETNATPNRGMKIDDNGMRGYDADGDRYMKADETGLEMTGSISTKGKTAEATPRDIAVRLTTMTRDTLYGTSAKNPGLVFDDGNNLNGELNRAPGIYSADGKSLTITGRDSIDGRGRLDLSSRLTSLNAEEIVVGSWDGIWDTVALALRGRSITVGSPTDFFHTAPSTVNLVGNVNVNGNPVMKTVIAGLPTGAQPVELIGTGSARTSASGVFTITFPPNTFTTTCMTITANPTSGTAGIPVVNGGRLFAGTAEMVIPSAPNTTITYSYRAVGY